MDDLLADLRSFSRTLRRQPALSTTVVGILGLGIAAAVVVYGVVEALVLDPFPYPEPERLVVVGSEMPKAGRELGFFERLSGPEIEDIRQRGHTLEHLLPFDLNSVRVQGDAFPERLFALYTWADPFATLGLPPQLGRGFTAAELRRSENVAVISDALWRGRFGTDPEVLGRVLEVDGVPYTVVGVIPPAATIYGTDLWLPLTESPTALARDRRQFNLLARIATGADLDAVDTDLRAIADSVARDLGSANAMSGDVYAGWRLAATPWARFNAFTYDDEAVLTLGAIVFVLLLVCANLANLLLTRAAARRGEAALRFALGASRERIARQVWTESALFAVCGGVVGVGLAAWGLDAVTAWLPGALQPFAKPIALDHETLGFASAIVVFAAVACGLAPALHLARAMPSGLPGTNGFNGSRTTAGRATRGLHRALVVAQVAVAVVLLAGAGSLLTAWLELTDQDLGFAAEELVSMRLSLPGSEYTGDAVPLFFADLQAEVAALPGAHSASIATQVAPGSVFTGELRLEGTLPEDVAPRLLHTVVGDDYFESLGIAITSGRTLDARDRFGGACAVVVNTPAAERYFPGRSPLGRRVQVVGSRFESGWCEVVGVAAGVRNQGLAQPSMPEIFTSHRQAGGRFNQMYLVARADAEPLALVPAIRAIVQRLDPEQPVYAIGTAEQVLASQLAPRRVTAHLLSGFAAVALLLAALGIYGVVAYGVAQRRQEMSLRLSLGAQRRDLASLVVRESLATVGVGLGLGLLGAVALAGLLRDQLATIADPSLGTLAAPAAVLAATAWTAAAWPAWRAGRTDPAEVLRRP